ncbi:MAG: hypothetical protein R3B67_06800 [Phycisphaerales bacterium]
MGTWGTAILSNKYAAGVLPASSRRSIADGKTIEEAEDQLIADQHRRRQRPLRYSGCPFWLGKLAAKQVQLGRLSTHQCPKSTCVSSTMASIISIWEQESPKDVN